jgi:hypothetical protein
MGSVVIRSRKLSDGMVWCWGGDPVKFPMFHSIGRGEVPGVSELLPDQVFVVAAVDQCVDFAAVVSVEEAAALDAGTKEEVGRFGLKDCLGSIASFGVQLSAFAGDVEGDAGSELVGPDEVVEVCGVDRSDGGVFVEAKQLSGYDLICQRPLRQSQVSVP